MRNSSFLSQIIIAIIFVDILNFFIVSECACGTIALIVLICKYVAQNSNFITCHNAIEKSSCCYMQEMPMPQTFDIVCDLLSECLTPTHAQFPIAYFVFNCFVKNSSWHFWTSFVNCCLFTICLVLHSGCVLKVCLCVCICVYWILV